MPWWIYWLKMSTLCQRMCWFKDRRRRRRRRATAACTPCRLHGGSLAQMSISLTSAGFRLTFVCTLCLCFAVTGITFNPNNIWLWFCNSRRSNTEILDKYENLLFGRFPVRLLSCRAKLQRLLHDLLTGAEQVQDWVNRIRSFSPSGCDRTACCESQQLDTRNTAIRLRYERRCVVFEGFVPALSAYQSFHHHFIFQQEGQQCVDTHVTSAYDNNVL